jgi:hypothetical protein
MGIPKSYVVNGRAVSREEYDEFMRKLGLGGGDPRSRTNRRREEHVIPDIIGMAFSEEFQAGMQELERALAQGGDEAADEFIAGIKAKYDRAKNMDESDEDDGSREVYVIDFRLASPNSDTFIPDSSSINNRRFIRGISYK